MAIVIQQPADRRDAIERLGVSAGLAVAGGHSNLRGHEIKLTGGRGIATTGDDHLCRFRGRCETNGLPLRHQRIKRRGAGQSRRCTLGPRRLRTDPTCHQSEGHDPHCRDAEPEMDRSRSVAPGVSGAVHCSRYLYANVGIRSIVPEPKPDGADVWSGVRSAR